jgi:hypothetical protein
VIITPAVSDDEAEEKFGRFAKVKLHLRVTKQPSNQLRLQTASAVPRLPARSVRRLVSEEEFLGARKGLVRVDGAMIFGQLDDSVSATCIDVLGHRRGGRALLFVLAGQGDRREFS